MIGSSYLERNFINLIFEIILSLSTTHCGTNVVGVTNSDTASASSYFILHSIGPASHGWFI